MLGLLRFSPRASSSLQVFAKPLSISSVKCKSDDENKRIKSEIEKQYQEPKSMFQAQIMNKLGFRTWNERRAIRNTKKSNRFLKRVDNMTDFIKGIQSTNNYPLTLEDWKYFFKRRQFKNMMLEQKFLPERHSLLKPDLAAAHFILGRGGAVKFESQKDWIGGKYGKVRDLPTMYIPGFYIEAIDAENTNLYYEGLKNLCRLRFLKWLSLKGLNEIDDWCLDYVSKEFYQTLEFLDVSDCKNVTYRALSCFYRFENLKTLVLQGVPDTVELKLACIMLQEIMPDLDIKGIDLTVPKKIEPLKITKVSEGSPENILNN